MKVNITVAWRAIFEAKIYPVHLINHKKIIKIIKKTLSTKNQKDNIYSQNKILRMLKNLMIKFMRYKKKQNIKISLVPYQNTEFQSLEKTD